MSGAPLRLLMLLILLLSGLHTAEPADASVTHHADSAHILFHEERGQVLDDDGSGSQQDADLHGSHHNCPVASDQALSGSHDLGCFSGGLLFAMPATRLVSRALAPPLKDRKSVV